MQSWFSFAIFCGNIFQALALASRNSSATLRDTAGTSQKSSCVFSSYYIPQKCQLSHCTNSAVLKAGGRKWYFHLNLEHLSLKCHREGSPSPATQAHHVFGKHLPWAQPASQAGDKLFLRASSSALTAHLGFTVFIIAGRSRKSPITPAFL